MKEMEKMEQRSAGVQDAANVISERRKVAQAKAKAEAVAQAEAEEVAKAKAGKGVGETGKLVANMVAEIEGKGGDPPETSLDPAEEREEEEEDWTDPDLSKEEVAEINEAVGAMTREELASWLAAEARDAELASMKEEIQTLRARLASAQHKAAEEERAPQFQEDVDHIREVAGVSR